MPQNTRESLEKIASGFQAARILLSGTELDVFSIIGQEALDAGEVARQAKADRGAMERLLNALVSMKVLTKRKGLFRNTTAAQKHLTQDAPEPLRGIMMHRVGMWDTWSKLTRVVRTGKVPPRKKTRKREENFIKGMADVGLLSARETADVLKKELKAAKRVLDVGGGPAVYACAWAKRFDHLKVTQIDLPGPPMEIAKENIKSHGLAGRVKIKTADAVKAKTYGRNYDLVFLSNFIHCFQRPIARSIVAKAARALKPGGVLAIKEFFAEKEGTAPPFTAIFSINMLVADAGDTFTRDEVEGWMKEAGLKPKRFVPVAMASALLTGVK
jgi:2-polyprenyl-3-methyl-5-hydroxy-6-metoxy-1,4-benzoquinol methylase